MNGNIIIRTAVSSDIPAMIDFIFEHGANEWNYLPEEDVKAYLGQIANGGVQAVVAGDDDTLLGFITFNRSTHLARYQAEAKEHGYIGEAVVHRSHAGKGIGTALLKAALDQLSSQGLQEIYVERHEENPGSAGMMRKAGFVEVDTFDDPARRFSGSRRTTVCRIVLQSTVNPSPRGRGVDGANY